MILMLALGAIVSSCEDAYEIRQKGERNDPYEVYKTPADINSGLNTIYASIPGTTELELSSVFTDELAIGPANGGQGLLQGEYNFFMEPGSAYAANIWRAYYTMINRINRLEQVALKLQSQAKTTEEKTKYNNPLAELYVLRAYAHYKLFAYFTPDYTNQNGLSVIKLDHVPPVDFEYSLPRSTVKEIVDFILADLEKSSMRTEGWVSSNYVNAGVINSIRTKLYAMTGDWDKVLEYGQLVLNQYPLVNAGEYTSMFAKDAITANFSENIFSLKSTINTGPRPVGIWYSARPNINGNPFYKMGRSLYNELDALDPAAFGQASGVARTDVRYAVNLLPASDGTTVKVDYENLPVAQYRSEEQLLVGKYRGNSQKYDANDIVLFRSADILLAMAEARAAKGQLVGASTDPDDVINVTTDVYSILATLRAKRSTSGLPVGLSVPTSQQQAYNMILKERRVEFAFEGHRYLDMKRLGVKAGSEGFTRYSKDCQGIVSCNLPANSYKLTLPIPQVELNGNKKINQADQNPGY